jgi:two-component system, OmpR family, phosphate regulon sensor histidine kinase PhoR
MKRPRLVHQYLLITFIILAIIVFLAASSAGAVQRGINNTAKENLMRMAAVIINLRPSDMFEKPGAAHHFAQEAAADLNSRFTIIDKDGNVLGDSHRDPSIMDNHAGRPEIREIFHNGDGISVRYSDTMQQKMFYAAVPVISSEGMEGIVRVAVPYMQVQESAKVMPFIHILQAALSVVVVIGSLFFLFRSVKRPLENIRKGTSEYSIGNYTYTISIRAPMELESLANMMTHMAAEIRRKLLDLTEERNEIESVLDAMQEPVVLVDSKLRIMRINPAALRLVEPGRTRIMGKSVIDVFRNTALDEFVRKALIEAKELEDEIVMYRNEEIILHVYAKALPRKGGSTREGVELLLVFNDLTKIRQLERVRKDFVANVSHELKTPLTLIKGFVETLSESKDVEPEQLGKFLKIIDKHTHRLVAIIDDLLSLSKLESGEEKILNFTAEALKPILMQASGNLRSISRKRGIMVALRVEKSIKVTVNRQLIEQAVINLLDNSLKYSDEGSTVLISAGEENSEVWISIKDEGCGIPLAEQERIFERFYRVDKARSRDLGGTGLGLSIVNHVVQLHKGKIELDSAPGRGSTFTIRIPKRKSEKHHSSSKYNTLTP